MMGTDLEPGIIRQAAEEIFNTIENASKMAERFAMKHQFETGGVNMFARLTFVFDCRLQKRNFYCGLRTLKSTTKT